MTKASFDELLGLVHDLLVLAPTHHSPISPAERLAVTLRYVYYYKEYSLGAIFRMHKATLSGSRQETLPAIGDCLSPLGLQPPTSQQWEEIQREFCVMWNFPNAIRSIDGKHFAIRCPSNSDSIFHKYKKLYSMVLLAVVDANYWFR
ncbi:unnamed protein product, partial [Ixodes persulcatus]